MNTLNIPFPKYKETGITILGSSNIDLFLYVESFPKDGNYHPFVLNNPNKGETIHAKQLNRTPGGKGSNQAIMLSKLSSKSEKRNVFVGCVGDDAGGKVIIENYKENNFLNVEKHIRVIENCFSGHASIIVNEKGMNKIILDYGANKRITKEHVDKSFCDITKTKIFVTQYEVNLDIVQYAVKKAKEKGLFTIVNPAPAKKNVEKDFYKYIDVIIPNENEAELLVNQKVSTIEDAKIAAKKIQQLGCKNVIITLGASGCLVLQEGKDKCEHLPVPMKLVNVVDTTGAGDAFVGAFAYFLNCQEDFMKSVKYATYIATLSVQVRGKGCQGSYPTLNKDRSQLIYEKKVLYV